MYMYVYTCTGGSHVYMYVHVQCVYVHVDDPACEMLLSDVNKQEKVCFQLDVFGLPEVWMFVHKPVPTPSKNTNSAHNLLFYYNTFM